MACTRIALLVLLTLLGAERAVSQEVPKDVPPSPVTTPAEQPATQTQNPKRLRVGSKVAQANLLVHQVQPVYPSEAKKKHVEGSVLLDAVIGKDGTITDLKYISGPPLLMKSAMDAVRQWVYKPTLLKGEPVEV